MAEHILQDAAKNGQQPFIDSGQNFPHNRMAMTFALLRVTLLSDSSGHLIPFPAPLTPHQALIIGVKSIEYVLTSQPHLATFDPDDLHQAFTLGGAA
jgi:hypothetical protein